MHFCWTIPEILSQIFLYLEDAHLVSAALTTKSFKPVALGVLWRNLPNLSPVIRCLPQDTWQCQRSGYEQSIRSFVLCRKLSPQDWTPVLPYLPLIRSIDSSYSTKVSGGFLDETVATFPGQVLFPNLRTIYASRLDVSTDFESMLRFIQFILGPQLDSLSIGLAEDSSRKQAYVSLIQSLPILCPLLKKIDLGYNTRDFAMISRSVCQWQHLETLVLPSLSETALIHVAQLPGLCELTLNRQNASGLTQFPRVTGPTFPALLSLELQNSSPSFHISILAAIYSPKFEYYGSGFDRIPTVEEMGALFAQLVTMPHAPTVINLYDALLPTSDYADHPLIPDIFRPLLTIEYLKTLNLEAYPAFDIDDLFVLELALACPRLTTFSLGTVWSRGQRTRATMMSYVYLLRYCPDMETIGLVIDASKVDNKSRDDPAEGIQNLAGSVGDFDLRVGDSYIEDPVDVALFLSSLVDLNADVEESFLIVPAEDCPSDIQDKWDRVQELLPAFLTARAQEGSRRLAEWR